MPYTGLPSGFSAVEFSAREREVIAELARGCSIKQIADRLRIKVNTVKDYTKTIYSKAQVHSARQLLIQIYSNNHVNSGSRDSGTLVDVFDGLLSAQDPRDLLQGLRRGAMACTGADDSHLWRIYRQGPRTLAGPVEAECAQPVVAAGFLARVVEAGVLRSARIDGDSNHEGVGQSEVADGGLGNTGDAILGIALAPGWAFWCRLRSDLPQGPLLLLLARPRSLSFSDGDVAVCRLLARLAESQFSRLTFSRSATA